MSNELVGGGGFAALLILMLLRVPIGVAMGLVGIGGFGAVVGMGPGAEPAVANRRSRPSPTST